MTNVFCYRNKRITIVTVLNVCLVMFSNRVQAFSTSVHPSKSTVKHLRSFSSSSRENVSLHLSNKSENRNDSYVKNIIVELWYLPLLSILSGFSPALKIIGESHLSVLPDTPIAHDVKTMLLWPVTKDFNMDTPHVFQSPKAALTDESFYFVDWNQVFHAFLSTMFISFGVSGVILLILLVIADKSLEINE